MGGGGGVVKVEGVGETYIENKTTRGLHVRFRKLVIERFSPFNIGQ